jgi:hypothetical protein
VWLKGDLTGLKFGDELQNAAKEEFGSMKFILPLDVFGLLVDFDFFWEWSLSRVRGERISIECFSCE